jgi:hypothetical protein
MAIYVDGRLISGTRHTQFSKTFANSGGNGAVGDVTIFTTTGRVWLLGLTAFCTDGLAEAAGTATVQLGTAAVDGGIIAVVNAVDIDTNEWWTDGTPVAELDQMDAAQVDVLLSSDIVVKVTSQALTGGTIIFDAWYIPVTSDGRLS